MNIKLNKNILLAFLIINLFTYMGSTESIVEASINKTIDIKYENKIEKSKDQNKADQNKANDYKIDLDLEKYEFKSDNYELYFPKKRHTLLSTEDSIKFYYEDFMITTNIINSKINLIKNNNKRNIEVLKNLAIDLQDYPGYKVVTSSVISKNRKHPKYYYYELKNRNDIITFRNLTIMGLIPLKEFTGSNNYLMVSLNSNARNILKAQDIFDQMISSISLNKRSLRKYKSTSKTLNNKSLDYKITIPENYYSHTKNSDRLVSLKPIADFAKKNTDEITIRKFSSAKYSHFAKSDKKEFKKLADKFIKDLTKYSKNLKIENFSTNIIDKKNAIVFKTIESNSKNYITTLSCYIFYDNFGYVLKYSSTNLNNSKKKFEEIRKCFLSFKKL